jgi:endonuclease/exonuclease/phosphatase (EEP) superfamily protein YafD
MRRLVTALTVIAGLGAVTVTAVSQLWRIFPQTAALIAMAPQFGVAAAVLAVAALIVRRRVLAALCLGAALWNGILVWPDWAPFGKPAHAHGQPVLKVVTFNLLWDNPTLDATADYLIGSGADVIGLVEATGRSKLALMRLRSVYPYAVDCVGEMHKCQTMLFSKYPLTDAYSGPIDGRYPYIAIARVALPGGPVTVGVTHVRLPFSSRPRPPLVATVLDPPEPALSDAPALDQSVEAANLAAFLAGQPEDLVLIGDFNSTSWSPLQQAFRAATGLDNRGRLLPSWPSWAWPGFRLPIDEVFVRGRLEVTAARLGPDVGSDHLPVEAEISLRP